jgi:hypothetical protein
MEHKGLPLRADRHRSAKSRLGASSPSISSAYPLRTRLDERESEIESLREESSLAIGEIQRLHGIAARAQKLGLVTDGHALIAPQPTNPEPEVAQPSGADTQG